MKHPVFPTRTSATCAWLRVGISSGCLALCLLSLSSVTRADQVEMQNGDRYAGKVVALTNDTLILQSEVLGTLSVPRGKVASIALGISPGTNSVKTPLVGRTPARPEVAGRPAANALSSSSSLRDLANQTNLIQEVQQQFLAGADPAAKAKFNQMLSGLMTGKLNLNDLRTEAKSAADQLKSMKKDLGP